MSRGALVMLGPPGVGKGTYGRLLARALGRPLVTSGDLLRAQPKGRLDRWTNSGQLVPDEVVTDMVFERLREPDALASGVILDGFPRTVVQAKALETDLGQPVELVLKLALKRDQYLVDKLLGRRLCSRAGCDGSYNVAHVENPEEGVFMPALLPKNGSHDTCDCGSPLRMRADDTETVVRDRLAVYERETLPLRDFYRERGVLEEFTILRGLDDMPQLETLVKRRLSATASSS